MANESSIESLIVRAQGVALPAGLVLDEIDIDAKEVKYSPSTNITVPTPAKARVRVSASSIATYLETLRPGGLSGFDVRAEDGSLKVAATARVVVSIRAEATCSLVVTSEKTISLALQDAEPAASKPLIERQIGQINPIIDLSGLPYDFRIIDAICDEGHVTVVGTVKTHRS